MATTTTRQRCDASPGRQDPALGGRNHPHQPETRRSVAVSGYAGGMDVNEIVRLALSCGIVETLVD